MFKTGTIYLQIHRYTYRYTYLQYMGISSGIGDNEYYYFAQAPPHTAHCHIISFPVNPDK